MSETKRPLAYYIGENPLRIMEWPLWTTIVIAGLYILSPVFTRSGGESPNGALAVAVGSDLAFIIYGSLVALAGVLGITGIFLKKTVLRKTGAWIVFAIFLFFTILRIILMGPLSLGWVTYFFNTLFAAAIFLRIRWEELTDYGDSD